MQKLNRTEQTAFRQIFAKKPVKSWHVYYCGGIIDIGVNIALLKSMYKGKGYTFKAVY